MNDVIDLIRLARSKAVFLDDTTDHFPRCATTCPCVMTVAAPSGRPVTLADLAEDEATLLPFMDMIRPGSGLATTTLRQLDTWLSLNSAGPDHWFFDWDRTTTSWDGLYMDMMRDARQQPPTTLQNSVFGGADRLDALMSLWTRILSSSRSSLWILTDQLNGQAIRAVLDSVGRRYPHVNVSAIQVVGQYERACRMRGGGSTATCSGSKGGGGVKTYIPKCDFVEYVVGKYACQQSCR